MIPLFKVFMAPGIGESLEQVLQSGYVGQGTKVEEFEKQLAESIGSPYVCTVNSATSGLTLALHLCKTEGKDEVISTPMTCTATNWSILANGLKIRWADVNRSDLNIDPSSVISQLSPRTVAIMAVHWAGYACDLEALRSAQNACQRMYGHRPPIIEDCSHAWSASFNGVPLGNHGNICVFSFQAIKHLSTADGGLVVSPDSTFHERVKLGRWYGLDRSPNLDLRSGQDVTDWGFKFHMNDVNATIGLRNLPYVCENIRRHKENASFFNSALDRVEGLALLQQQTNRDSPHWIYSILVEDRINFNRKMSDAGVMVNMVHERNDKHSCVAAYATDLPNTDYVSSRLTNLPCGWWVTDANREEIVSLIKSGW